MKQESVDWNAEIKSLDIYLGTRDLSKTQVIFLIALLQHQNTSYDAAQVTLKFINGSVEKQK